VYSCIPLIALAGRFSCVAAFIIAATMFNGCGSRSDPASAATAALPPAIPASEPVLLFNGTGTSADVSAVQAVLSTLGIGYTTADSDQFNAMTKAELGGYKLIVVPGGNSIEIGQSLNGSTAGNLRGAVQQYGVHYLGICAGAFFGAHSGYNGVDLTGGLSFDFYADEFKGIHQEVIEISFPDRAPLNIYWEDGPQLSGWGEVAGKFPDGTPAIVQGQSGKGFVIFTGVHPEAPANWFGPMMLQASVNVDQAYAGTLIKAALTGVPLPNF
jgi:biotin protein ligase-like protein